MPPDAPTTGALSSDYHVCSDDVGEIRVSARSLDGRTVSLHGSTTTWALGNPRVCVPLVPGGTVQLVFRSNSGRMIDQVRLVAGTPLVPDVDPRPVDPTPYAGTLVTHVSWAQGSANGGGVGTASQAVQGAARTASDTANGAVATVTGTVLPVVALAQDPDRDGHDAPAEALGRSDPANGASRPTSDGDGVQNQDERTRLHARGPLVGNALARTAPGDKVTFRLGHAGARATVRSPEGDAMTVPDAPREVGSGCPPSVTISVPDASACTMPVVASFSLAGGFLAARRAHDPGAAVPASAFVVLCSPRTLGAGTCLQGVGADGAWQPVPATHAARDAPAEDPRRLRGLLGKTSNDVAADGWRHRHDRQRAERPRRALARAPVDWHLQAAGTTPHACSGGLASPCLSDGAPRESVFQGRPFLGGGTPGPVSASGAEPTSCQALYRGLPKAASAPHRTAARPPPARGAARATARRAASPPFRSRQADGFGMESPWSRP